MPKGIYSREVSRLSTLGLAEGVVYRDKIVGQYVLTKCTVCGKPKTSLLRNGIITNPICRYCANHTPKKREMMSNLFKGRPKTDGQKDKLRIASMGNTNCLGKHLSDVTKAKLSVAFKGRTLSPETRHKMSVAVKARPPRTLEHCQRLSLSLKGRCPDDNVRQAAIMANTGRKLSQEHRNILRESNMESWRNPISREKRLVAQKIACNKPEHKAKCKQHSLAMWGSRSLQERNRLIQQIIQHSNRKPNKKEMRLMELINLACPNEYKYTGDGSIAIGGKIPDYTNINGHKKVIEMFGDYFHSPEIFKGKVKVKWHRTEHGCKDTYRKYGFDCLVIWEKELKSQTVEQIIGRIREFTYGTK